MQSIANEMPKCVAFISYNSSEGEKIAGTAFLLSKNLEGEKIGQVRVFLISAKHVIAGIQQNSSDSMVIIRLNTRDGTKKIKKYVYSWKSHSEDHTVDASAAH